MAIVATGSTIAFATSSFTAEVLSIEGSDNNSREALQTSHLGTTGAHTHVPTTLLEGGTYSMRCFYAPVNKPPSSASAETITVTYGTETTNTDVFSGFVTGTSKSAELEALVEATINIKVTGSVA